MRFILAISVVAATSALATSTAALAARGQSPSSAEITFTKHVAPILQNRCQVCHRPDTFAPMSLLSYEQVRPWARAIKTKVVARQMPPWFIDKTVGIQDYVSDHSLTDAEIDTIVKWVDSGAARGNPADMPPPRAFRDEQQWQFGKYGEPDLIVTLPKDYMLPATGPDKWPEIVVDPKLTEDRYLAGVQLIPTKGHQLIHHLIANVLPPKSEAQFQQGDVPAEERGFFLNEYAIGKGADLFADNAGRLIPAGSKFSLQLHLHPTYGAQNGGKETAVNVALGLKFHPKGYKPQFDARTIKVPYGVVDIRPGETNARVDGYYRLTQATRLLSWQPHMHNRGSYSCIQALMPPQDDSVVGFNTGASRSERVDVKILSCAGFSFNWHLNYVYTDDSAPLLPAGTILQTLQWYDNSRANPSNPDPDAQVTRGNRTIDEMAGAWISLYYLSDEEFEKQVNERKQRQHPVTTSSN